MKKIFHLVATALIATCAFAQVDPDRTVATVNGEDVKGNEYYRRMEFLPNVEKRFGASIGEFPPGFLTLEVLVTEKLVQQLAKERGVFPTDAEVDAELRARSEDDPKILENWLATGRTKEDLLYQIRVELCQFKLVSQGVTVTDDQVKKVYTDHPELFTIPKRYKLRIIVVSTADAQTIVDQDLAAGKSFGDVASARSEDMSKAIGGQFGTVPVTLIPDLYRKALDGVKIGKTTGWIKTDQGDGIAKLYLEDVLKEQLEPLTPKLIRVQRRRMMLEQGSQTNNLEQEMIDMRRKAKIDIKEKEFSDMYAKFIAAYLHERTP